PQPPPSLPSPDSPIRYVPRPLWARLAAPHLYFLPYHSPAPLDDPQELEYFVTPIDAELPPSSPPSPPPAPLDDPQDLESFVTPIDADMPPDEQERLLRATHDGVIKLNHVVHHGGIGHHVQNWYAAHAPSRIGRIAAVDCASRIALFC